MEAFVRRMIDEHLELTARVRNLEKFVYSDESSKVNRAEFANMCIQLKGMRIYEEALAARLINQGVVFENGQYFEKLTTTNSETATSEEK